jgi:hypothetical protein
MYFVSIPESINADAFAIMIEAKNKLPGQQKCRSRSLISQSKQPHQNTEKPNDYV